MTKTRLTDALEKGAQIASQKEGLDGFEHPPKKQKSSPSPKKPVVRYDTDRIAVAKVGFDYSEDDYHLIKIEATKSKKDIKDLLAEILDDWLKRNNLKKN